MNDEASDMSMNSGFLAKPCPCAKVFPQGFAAIPVIFARVIGFTLVTMTCTSLSAASADRQQQIN
jgi:hypothetical protein